MMRGGAEPRTLAVVGAGPGIGMAVARRFGAEGYSVALIARSGENLDGYVAALDGLGIEAAGFVADVTAQEQLLTAISAVQERFGRIDVVEYSPMVSYEIVKPVLELDVEMVRRTLDLYLMGPILVVNAVIGPMIEHGNGALLFTSGASGIATYPSHGSVSVAMAGLRQYVRMLNVSLGHRGVFAGSILVAKPPAPDEIADRFWRMVETRANAEFVFGALELGEAYENLAARGYGPGFPPGLTRRLPEPEDEAERRLFLLALYQARINAMWHDDPARAEADADREAARFGGALGEANYGVELSSST